MMEIHDMFQPSILLCETHFPYQSQRGVMADAVSRIVDEGYYRNIQIQYIDDPHERNRIKAATTSKSISVTQWVSLSQIQKGLDLSTPDKSVRLNAIKQVKEYLAVAGECGADSVGVLPGKDPGIAQRPQAIEYFYQSMCELAECALHNGKMQLFFEPLDRGAHKNGVIGPTSDFIAFIKRLRHDFSNTAITWDSAHVALCEEDIARSLVESFPYTHTIHLSNAIVDRHDKSFGDHHMPIGPPGFLSVDTIANLFGAIYHARLFKEKTPCISVEVRTHDHEDPWMTEAHCRNTLVDSWKKFIEGHPDLEG